MTQVARQESVFSFECRGEVLRVFVADEIGYFVDEELFFQQEVFGFFHSDVCDEAKDGVVEEFFESPF